MKTLKLLESKGIRPSIVRYLDAPPSADTVLGLAGQLGVPVRELVRTSDEHFIADRDSLDLADDRALATWVQQHPSALQRPIVVDDATGRAVIGRPPENVLALLTE